MDGFYIFLPGFEIFFGHWIFPFEAAIVSKLLKKSKLPRGDKTFFPVKQKQSKNSSTTNTNALYFDT